MVDKLWNISINQALSELYEKNTESILKEWKNAFCTKNSNEVPPCRINEFGIIDIETFDRDNGILFIGKETNGWRNEDYANNDLFLPWIQNIAKGNLPTEGVAKKHPAIWYNIGRWAKLISDNNFDIEKLAQEKNEALKGLSHIAFTNINKVRGKNSSGQEFWKFSESDVVKSVLQQEIKKLNPKYIVLCGISEEYLKAMSVNGKIIKMPHPSARKSKITMLRDLKIQL